MPIKNTKSRLAIDEITVDEEAMEKAIEYLTNKLKPEEISHLKAMLKGEEADDEPEAEAEDSQVDRMVTKDSSPPFKGMPKPGGKMVAADARPNTFADRWPSVARIRVGY